MPDGWIAHSEVYFHSSQQIDVQDNTAIEDAKQHCASLSGCVGFTVHATADTKTFAQAYFENGLQMVYAPGWTAFEKPSGPTPTPVPTPPVPTPLPRPTPKPTPMPQPTSLCPVDADVTTSSDGRKECLWRNGVRGLEIPPSASQYCDYIADGYFGYFWSASEEDYDCAPSARKSSNDQTRFCVWTDGEHGLKIPPSSIADCDHLSEGRIGLVLSDAILI